MMPRHIILKIAILLLIAGWPARAQQIAQIDTTGFDSLLGTILRDHPEIRIQNQEVQRYREQVYQSKVSFLRNFRLGMNFYQADPNINPEVTGLVPRFGINLSLDLESFFATPSRVRESQADLKAASIKLEQTRAQTRREVLSRYLELKKAVQTYQIELEKYRAIHDIFVTSEKKFLAGEITLESYSQMVENHANAKQGLLEQEFNVHLARAQLLELVRD